MLSRLQYVRGRLFYTYTRPRVIKTHGSESRGQERAKQSPKAKRAMNYRVSFTRSERFRQWECLFYGLDRTSRTGSRKLQVY